MWLLFALLSGVFYTGQGLLTRHLLKGQKDSWAFSFYYSLVGAIISFPFMIASPKTPSTLEPWLLGFVAGSLIVVQNYFYFKSSNYLEASISGAITKFRLVWVLVFGIVLLHEGYSFEKLLGTIFTIAAGLLILKKFKTPGSVSGVLLAFIATFFYGIVIILYKFLFDDFNFASLTFFVTFLPPILINLVVMPNAFRRITKLIENNRKSIFLACGFGALANLSMNQALALGDASSVLVIIEVFLILTLVGEHVILKEREQLWIKLLTVILAVAGAVLIQISN